MGFVLASVVLDTRSHKTPVDEGAARDVVDRGLDDSDSRIGFYAHVVNCGTRERTVKGVAL
jgi:hypothetical protein